MMMHPRWKLIGLLIAGSTLLYFHYLKSDPRLYPWHGVRNNRYKVPITLKTADKFTIPANHLCLPALNGEEFFSLVIVVSAVANFEKRMTIRETWASELYDLGNKGPVRLGFLLGTSMDEKITNQVEKESEKYQDIIQTKVLDTRQNLSSKSISMLLWVSLTCTNPLYVMKTEDDVYVNLINLVSAANELSVRKNVIFGYVHERAPTNEEKPHYMLNPMFYLFSSVETDYLSETSYVMSTDVAPYLYNACSKEKFSAVMSDGFVTGICASKVGVEKLNMEGFPISKVPSTGCAYNRIISGHKVSMAEMRKIWEELRNTDITCPKE